jgi:hypothetical protein
LDQGSSAVADDASPATLAEDIEAMGAIEAVTIESESFENVFDRPFMTMNKIDGVYVAEVVLSGEPTTDLGRIQTVLDVGKIHGVEPWARVHGDDNPAYRVATIHFAPAELTL